MSIEDFIYQKFRTWEIGLQETSNVAFRNIAFIAA